MRIVNPHEVLKAYHELNGESPQNGIPSSHKIPGHPGDRLMEYTAAGAAAARQGLAKTLAKILSSIESQTDKDFISSMHVIGCANALRGIVGELTKINSEFIQLHSTIGIMKSIDSENLWLAIDEILIYEEENLKNKPPSEEKDLIRDYIDLTKLMCMAGKIGFGEFLQKNPHLQKYFPQKRHT